MQGAAPWPGQHFFPGCRVTQCPELQKTSPVLKREVAMKPPLHAALRISSEFEKDFMVFFNKESQTKKQQQQ